MKHVIVASLIAALGLASVAIAQTEPTGVIKERQDGMKLQGKSVKAIKDELDKSAPSLDVIKKSVAALKDTQPHIMMWYPKGTGVESGMKTKALPAIWEKPADFKKAQDVYQAELVKFSALADAGDIAAIKAEFPSLGKSCGGCHSSFRKKDD